MATTPATATDDPAGSVRPRRAPMALVTGVVIILVLVIVASLLLFKVTRTNQTDNGRAKAVLAPGAVVARRRPRCRPPSSTRWGPRPPTSPSRWSSPARPPLTSRGRAEVVYVGSEFCPYCAAVRWSLVVALSRFGTFSHLGQTRSSSSEAFPGLQSFSFDGASYQSRYGGLVGGGGIRAHPRQRRPRRVPACCTSPAAEAQTLMTRYGPDGAGAGGHAALRRHRQPGPGRGGRESASRPGSSRGSR